VTTLANHAVDALNDVYGAYPGYRAAHAKGTLCEGRFVATPEARRLTRASFMQGDPVAATVRFSNCSGIPTAPDGKREVRGMATKFHLRDGSRADILAITAPCFFSRLPEDFIEFTRANKSPRRLLWFLATHREALPAIRAARAMKPVPSYANCRYHAIHAFKWIDSLGSERYVRYTWLPEAGEASISADDAKALDPDFLRQELIERLERGPVRFTLEVQLAAEGDAVADATVVLPKDRETVVVGTLALTELDYGPERPGEPLVFDPTRVTDGIELSDDPILRFRPQAYSVSVERRSAAAAGEETR
jgi:catalase